MPSTSGRFFYGQITVGTTAVNLPGGRTVFGVLIKPDPANTGKIYVGGKGVTTTNGYLLEGSLCIEIDEQSKIYLISDTLDQKVYYIGV